MKTAVPARTAIRATCANTFGALADIGDDGSYGPDRLDGAAHLAPANEFKPGAPPAIVPRNGPHGPAVTRQPPPRYDSRHNLAGT
jgi:hypothetical protein